MPAEWEPHEATWLAWPHNKEDWPGKFEPIPWVWVEIVRHLTNGEGVNILVQNDRIRVDAEDKLRRAGADLRVVRFHQIATDRVWLRDSGPTFVVDGRQLRSAGFAFNAWAKYDNCRRDATVAGKISQLVNAHHATQRIARPSKPNEPADHLFVMEGGAIDVNGVGSLICTEECLLSKKQCRNPGFTRADYEAVFAERLGVRNVIWLGAGIVGDDTHGHVDDLARFVNTTTVVLVQESNPGDANYKRLAENRERLESATDQDGHKLTVVPLPMPAPMCFDGERLPASYANFYIANEAVLVPTFNDPADRMALGTLSELFPDRRVVGIHAVDLVWGLGTIHCLSQQQPKLV